MDEGRKETNNCRAVAFMDILGSSDILLNGSEKDVEEYAMGLGGLYDLLRKRFPVKNLRLFSDNVLIYTDDDEPEGLASLIGSVASIQFHVTADFRMLLRGGIVIDILNHVPADTNDFVVGRGVVNAYRLESKKAVYPRIVVSDRAMDVYSRTSPAINYLQRDSDMPFVDYLKSTAEGGFVDTG